ncbi:hypothetical protein F5Y16DRAFT_203440 [Xylariaceae sp. FL0255]|nr:hypothetical protein F5Y16DRAFT_203440 [Xylariaceae sp. FL0255]
MPTDRIHKEGFTYAYGRFFAGTGRSERIEASSLRDAFLPRVTAAGNKYLRDDYDFVKNQLKHYGVTYGENEYSGQGTRLLQKALKEGKCDQVPQHITELQAQMHVDWLQQLTPEDLVNCPEYILEKYFVTATGQPDRSKTTSVVGIPVERRGDYRVGKIREIGDTVEGLHQATGYGCSTETVFLGWDAKAVKKAAERHAAEEAKAMKEANAKREQERNEEHARYLKTIKGKKGAASTKNSPVGSYMIDCPEIEGGWPDQDDLSMDIQATDEPGIFEASFDFGVVEGAMVLSTDKKSLEDYIAELEDDDDDNEEDDEEDDYDSDDGSRKRKSGPVSRDRGRPPKKTKRSNSKTTLRFHLKFKCRETGEGQIFYEPEEGTITFENDIMAKFSGVADFPCVGKATFIGRKTAAVPAPGGSTWDQFSYSSYEYARVSRWN